MGSKRNFAIQITKVNSNNIGEISKIATALAKTVKDSDLQNVTLDLTEALSDSFLDDGLFRDIPILGTLTGLYKTSGSIQDKLLTKKLVHFLMRWRQEQLR